MAQRRAAQLHAISGCPRPTGMCSEWWVVSGLSWTHQILGMRGEEVEAAGCDSRHSNPHSCQGCLQVCLVHESIIGPSLSGSQHIPQVGHSGGCQDLGHIQWHLKHKRSFSWASQQ